ncbi:hypothetical protein PGTUg99_035514 [Puccinia graminis f. sp. tritici]|uniref:Uncharacterized protein n=1 Tax=Puccinia graminis f. sp. tritici TaxID=56615 RepID=A0A5B0SLM6_PUCGR|nr:hypothetical protein PGTUg99_035514 [Puccinia graminis f. sp. tritici]
MALFPRGNDKCTPSPVEHAKLNAKADWRAAHPAQSALGPSSSSSVSSTQLPDPAQSALGPSSSSSEIQLIQLWDPAHSALKSSSSSSSSSGIQLIQL